MWPEARLLEKFLVRVRARLALLRAAEGAAAGLVAAALLDVAGLTSNVIAVCTIGTAIAVRTLSGDDWRWGWWRSLTRIAQRVERQTPVARNLIVTAAELRHSRSYVNDAVMNRASRIARSIDSTSLFPSRNATLLLVSAVAVFAAVRLRPVDVPTGSERRSSAQAQPIVHDITVSVVPPAYSELPAQSLRNPAVVEALANSAIEVAVSATAATVRLETLTGVQDLEFGSGAFHGRLPASADGFVAIQPHDSGGRAGPRRLLGLTIRDDHPPRVILTAPGRDLFFSVVPPVLDVALSAEDDLALDSLQLRYTTVSGSGERFTFVERAVPLAVRAGSDRSWSARGSWPLHQLQLAPGDLLVYRAVARDRRPGAAPSESESYVIEVVAPGAIAAGGFAADDQRDRYAASQQMVILKTERLIARRGAIAPDSLRDEARLLSAEQRQVRAEFVFMMGGELEDLAPEAAGTLDLNEVAEAEAEADILAGRLQNQGRLDMKRAIRAMSRASAALTDADLERALRDERMALDNLMRAFSRSRFILRALTRRERIDLQRRLSGTVNQAGGLSGPAVEPVPDDRVAKLRNLLVHLATLSTGDSALIRSRVSDGALALVRSDPESDRFRQLAADIQGLLQESRVRQEQVDSLVRHIATLLRLSLALAPAAGTQMETDLIAGRLRDAVRQPRLRR